jgi:hypothetical protein
MLLYTSNVILLVIYYKKNLVFIEPVFGTRNSKGFEMKKGFSLLLGSLLVVSLLLSTTGIAKAVFVDPPTLPDPYVTPVSGDMEFTTELLPVQQFPGAQDYSQMLVPVGFPLGQAQFLDTGVIVSGMDQGKATVCFTFTGASSGWGGKVGVWNGTKWVLLSTTIKNLEESPNSVACAPITGNGTYVFIKYVADTSLLPKCYSGWSLGTDTDGEGRYFYASLNNLADGTPATLTFLSAVPSSNYSGFDGTTSANVGNLYPGDADFFDSNFETDGTVLVTLRVTAGGCTADLQITLGGEVVVEENLEG